MLRQKAIKAVKWTSLSAAVKGAVHFLQYALLAHYLAPAEFGSFGLVMLIVGFGQMFTDGGMANAIIHFQNMTKEQLSTLYWINLGAGAVLSVLMLLGAPFAAIFFGEPSIVSLCNWSSLVFLMVPLGIQFQALLQRDLKFDLLAKIHIASSLSGGACSIAGAIAGLGSFSLIFGLLGGTAMRTVLLVRHGLVAFRPQFVFCPREIKSVLGFGFYQVAQKLAGFLGSKADQLIIGKFLGVTQLGFYNLAYNLVILPIQGINPIITRVAFPVYSKLQNENGKLVRGYSEMLKLLALLNFPFFFTLFVFADFAVLAFYGPQWAESAALVRILSVVGIICSLSNPLGSIVLAKGRADLSFKWDLFVCISTTVAAAAGSRFGIHGVAWSLVGVYILYFFLEYFLMLEPLIGNFRSGYFIGSFLIPLSYCGLSGAIMLMANSFIVDKSSAVVTGISLGGITYFLCLLGFERPLLIRYFGKFAPLIGFRPGSQN